MNKFQKNNLTIALMFCMLKMKKIYPAYISQIVKNKSFFWWFQTEKNGIIITKNLIKRHLLFMQFLNVIISSFKSVKNKHDACRRKACMKKFCKSFREHAMEIIYFKKKKMKLLTIEQSWCRLCTQKKSL